MISGAHVVVYGKDADADRPFFRDVLGFKSVDRLCLCQQPLCGPCAGDHRAVSKSVACERIAGTPETITNAPEGIAVVRVTDAQETT
jgi:hypothetical protein